MATERIDHSNCNHPRTPKARKVCRDWHRVHGSNPNNTPAPVVAETDLHVITLPTDAEMKATADAAYESAKEEMATDALTLDHLADMVSTPGATLVVFVKHCHCPFIVEEGATVHYEDHLPTFAALTVTHTRNDTVYAMEGDREYNLDYGQVWEIVRA